MANAKVAQGKRNRKNGEKFEWKVYSEYRSRSDVLHVVNSSGSFGLWDIMGQYVNGTVFYISAKLNGYHKPEEREAMRAFIKKCQSKRLDVRFIVHYYESRRKRKRMYLNKPSDVEKLGEYRRGWDKC